VAFKFRGWLGIYAPVAAFDGQQFAILIQFVVGECDGLGRKSGTPITAVWKKKNI
jgi:hypothetical protein|tara:strand:+ start:213 stop:377 length:165 start_codon:yes stop_codon:yes gene_type:complete